MNFFKKLFSKKEKLRIMLITNDWLKVMSLKEIIELAKTSSPKYNAIYNVNTQKVLWEDHEDE